MGWALVSVVGFLVVTGLVAAMARSNTARWEREHRAPQAAARAHGAAMRRAWTRTLTRWEQDRDGPAEPAARPVLHLPAGLAAHLPHLHRPHLHRPHVHPPHVRSQRRARPDAREGGDATA